MGAPISRYLQNYISTQFNRRLLETTLKSDGNGRVSWELDGSDYRWARYLVRVCQRDAAIVKWRFIAPESFAGNTLPRAETYRVCRNDGYLEPAAAKPKTVFAPWEAHFSKVSPYHREIHVDPAGGLRVHGLCEAVSAMAAATVFQLPPVAAHYFRQRHPLTGPRPPGVLVSRPLAPIYSPYLSTFPLFRRRNFARIFSVLVG